MSDFPDWWRGQRPPVAYEGRRLAPIIQGPLLTLDLDDLQPGTSDLRPLTFFRARGRGLRLWVTDVRLSVLWSEFDGCHFQQRVKPVLNASGVAAQGSFGLRPAVYRSCTFERIRFKTAGGFSLGQARYEDCTFLNCRWEGALMHSADFVSCRFIGKMNGCVWFGEDRRHNEHPRVNVIRGNDFTQTVFTDNVGWRYNYPVDDQRFPDCYSPRSEF